MFALLRNTLRELDDGISGPRGPGAARAGRAAQAPLRGRLPAGARPLRRLRRRDGRALGFSAARGGLVCADCLGRGVPITPEAIEALAASRRRPLTELREQPPSAAAGEALRDAHQLYAYHTGSRLRSLRFAGATSRRA